MHVQERSKQDITSEYNPGGVVKIKPTDRPIKSLISTGRNDLAFCGASCSNGLLESEDKKN